MRIARRIAPLLVALTIVPASGAIDGERSGGLLPPERSKRDVKALRELGELLKGPYEFDAFKRKVRDASRCYLRLETGSDVGKPKWALCKMNQLKIRFDAFRFKTPEGTDNLDLYWLFNVPRKLRVAWYILPLEGSMKRGFHNFYSPDNLRLADPKLPAASHTILQRLVGGCLQPGKEYIIWFKFLDPKPVDMRVALTTVPEGSVKPDLRLPTAMGIALGLRPKDLSNAVKLGQRERVAEMLAKNPKSVHEKGRFSLRPIHFAAQTGMNDLVELLLSKGANVNVRDFSRSTPIWYAARENQLSTLELLVSRGGRVNVTNRKGSTPLSISCDRAGVDVVRFLIKHKADVNVTFQKNWTPLIVAIQKGRDEIVRVLLENGADCNKLNGVGKNGLHVAAESGTPAAAKLLLAHGAKPELLTAQKITAVHLAALHDRVAVLEALVGDHPERLKYPNREGRTPLCLALMFGALDSAEFLWQRGASLEAVDSQGHLPLHAAAYKEQPKSVRWLLDKGVKVDSRS
ncbi:MAG: ankyrin repeat domain-containing protein, partial [Planctomycetales bacterium]